MRALIGCGAVLAALIAPVAASAAAPAKRKPVVRRAAPATPAAPRITFTVVSDGTGKSPGADDVVLIAYIGRLANGTIFDKNPQAAMPVSDVVPGFGQALRRMKVGGSYHVTIPPSLGYGARVNDVIPANSTLIFDIMMFDYRSRAELEDVRKTLEAQDAAAAAAAAKKPAAP